MNKNTKTTLGIVAAAVVIAVVCIGYYNYRQNKALEQNSQGYLPGTEPIATGSTTPTSTPGGAASGSAGAGLASDVTSNSMSYTQAVTVYGNRRIQFDDTCRMTPITMVAKNGTTIMFDNRYRNARSFSLDGTRYSLAGYGFKLFTLTAKKLPHVVDVDCGTNQNSGKITLE